MNITKLISGAAILVTLSACGGSSGGSDDAENNSDAEPSLRIQGVTGNVGAGNAVVAETDTGNVSAVFLIALSKTSKVPVEVEVETAPIEATPGVDYDSVTTTLVFSPGVTAINLTVPVIGDIVDEDDESFIVSLSNASNATIDIATSQATIIDNDEPPTLEVSGGIGWESAIDGEVVFELSLSEVSGKQVTINYDTTGGSAVSDIDYTSTSGILDYLPGQQVKSLSVTVLDDVDDEPDETFGLSLSLPSNVALPLPSAVGTIQDNDPVPTIGFEDLSSIGNEGSTESVAVVLSESSRDPVAFSFMLAGTAVQDQDYTLLSPSIVTIPSGSDRTAIEFDIVADGASENGEDLIVTIQPSTAASTVDVGNNTHSMQLVDWQGTIIFGTSGRDEPTALAVDSNDDLVVAGGTSGSFPGFTNQGTNDNFLIKYTGDGTSQWIDQYGSTDTEEPFSIAVGLGDTVFAVGRTKGNLDGNVNAGAGEYDVFLSRYTPAGVRLWTEQFGTSAGDIGYDLAVNTNGVYLVGYTLGAIDGVANLGAADFFLANYDTDGNQQWIVQDGTTEGDVGRAITLDDTGNIYVAGYTRGVLDQKDGTGIFDTFIAKYNSSGVRQWVQQIGGTSSVFVERIALDTSGNIYIGGVTSGDLATVTSNGGCDVFLMQLNSSGTLVWQRLIGTVDADGDCNTNRAIGMSVTGAGNAYLAAHTEGSFSGYVNQGNSDIFVTRYSSTGTQQWLQQFGTDQSDFTAALVLDSAENILVTGMTWGSLDGLPNLSNAGDGFLVRLDNNGVRY